MQTVTLYFIATLVIGFILGSIFAAVLPRVWRMRKSLTVEVEPSTQTVKLLWRAVRGSFIEGKNASGNRVDFPIEPGFSYSLDGTGKRVLFFDAENALPIRLASGADPRVRVTGDRLREWRLGRKIQNITKSHGMDLEALGRIAIIGMVILGLMLVAILWLVIRLAQGMT